MKRRGWEGDGHILRSLWRGRDDGGGGRGDGSTFGGQGAEW